MSLITKFQTNHTLNGIDMDIALGGMSLGVSQCREIIWSDQTKLI